ncbi:hypothetical protein AMJ80_04085, partial [bacterium SM23_31]
RQLIELVCSHENLTQVSVNVIFVNSEHIRRINKRFLKHDYPTDVIAFNLNEPGENPEGEIYVCPELAETQAQEHHILFKEELFRLVIHGMLHLIGYDDADPDEQRRMFDKGEFYLRKFFNPNSS